MQTISAVSWYESLRKLVVCEKNFKSIWTSLFVVSNDFKAERQAEDIESKG